MTTKSKLTFKQRRNLIGVSTWGHTFIAYGGSDYAFLETKGLVRKATDAEIETHYEKLKTELYETKAKIVREATSVAPDFHEIKSLASHADYVARDIADRFDEAERLVVLNEQALKLVAELTQPERPKAEQPKQDTHILIDSSTRQPLQAGQEVTTFRGEKCTFVRVSRTPVVGGTCGKVIVKFAGDSEFGSEVYPGVIGAEFQQANTATTQPHQDGPEEGEPTEGRYN